MFISVIKVWESPNYRKSGGYSFIANVNVDTSLRCRCPHSPGPQGRKQSSRPSLSPTLHMRAPQWHRSMLVSDAQLLHLIFVLGQMESVYGNLFLYHLFSWLSKWADQRNSFREVASDSICVQKQHCQASSAGGESNAWWVFTMRSTCQIITALHCYKLVPGKGKSLSLYTHHAKPGVSSTFPFDPAEDYFTRS